MKLRLPGRRRRDDGLPPPAEFHQRLVAAVVEKVGPISITPTEHEHARPEALNSVFVLEALAGPARAGYNDCPMVFALEEHLHADGIVTMEGKVAGVLTEHADATPTEQARAVLTALGLPVNAQFPLPDMEG